MGRAMPQHRSAKPNTHKPASPGTQNPGPEGADSPIRREKSRAGWTRKPFAPNLTSLGVPKSHQTLIQTSLTHNCPPLACPSSPITPGAPPTADSPAHHAHCEQAPLAGRDCFQRVPLQFAPSNTHTPPPSRQSLLSIPKQERTIPKKPAPHPRTPDPGPSSTPSRQNGRRSPRAGPHPFVANALRADPRARRVRHNRTALLVDAPQALAARDDLPLLAARRLPRARRRLRQRQVPPALLPPALLPRHRPQPGAPAARARPLARRRPRR